LVFVNVGTDIGTNRNGDDQMTKWILQIVGAQMPASCRSRYVNIRVLEVDAGVDHVTSCRAKEVRRIVYDSGPVPHAGSTPRSGRVRAMSHAQSMIARRAEIEAAEREVIADRRQRIQSVVSAKLEAGQPLTAAEYALIG
jgi:hypothetical protein